MPDLFPPIEPYRTGFLPVDGLHTLHWEECGNPHGTPVVYLHGGPGGGICPAHRRLFDPTAWRIVLLDQRGAGRSTPYAETHANSPAHLVSDIEHLRQHLGIERWHVAGGSWGSTLALLYAGAHPGRILSLVLRGIFLMRRREIAWFLGGLREIRPEAWEAFAALIPVEERGDRWEDFLAAYLRLLENPDPSVHLAAARAWVDYEVGCSTLLPAEAPDAPPPLTKEVDSPLAMARLEAHFFARHLFTPDDHILRSVPSFHHIPAVIVQGRYDLVCPFVSAWELAQAWPEAELVVINDAGHSTMEPGIRAAFVAATERFKGLR